MCDTTDFELCRLCLNSGGPLVNVFDDNNQLEFMLENTIEDLIDVKVVEDANYPWLVCSNCMDKLTEFRLFKRRCAECLFVFHNRIQKGCIPGNNDWITNLKVNGTKVTSRLITVFMVYKEESVVLSCDNKDAEIPGQDLVDDTSDQVWALSNSVDSVDNLVRTTTVEVENTNTVGTRIVGGIKKELGDDTITTDAIDKMAVDVRDDMISVKEQIDTASECSVVQEIDTVSSIVTSIQEGGICWSDNEDSGNLDHSEDLCLSFNEEVDIKEEPDANLPLEKGYLGGGVSQLQDGDQEQDGVGNLTNVCKICNKVFAETDILKLHVMHVHVKKVNQFKCDLCSVVFKRKIDLNGHVATVHTAKRKYQCELCPRHFPHLSKLRNHMITHTSEKVFKCKICPKSYTQNGNLKKHLLTHTREELYRCEICLKAFQRKPCLKAHILKHNVEEQFKCEMCMTVFTRKGDMMRHVMLHTCKRSYQCAFCSKIFSKKENLKRHMFLHTGETSIRCEICSRAFQQKAHLIDHMLKHTGEKPYKCEICPAEYALKQAFTAHMYKHTGDEPYKCNICSMKFSLKIGLKRHTLTHSGERPHKCQICSRGFLHKKNLKGHMFTHTKEKPHKCELCWSGFSQKVALKRHMLTHAADMPHKCAICLIPFKHKSKLMRHEKEVHSQVLINI
ncbi:zinc finger protein 492-like [Hetaerina americana]|uniref:zinc finger protein 492-like n=1 Tax=Hetaerina americana TaxID=62018 RepID=UPI003A7F50D9